MHPFAGKKGSKAVNDQYKMDLGKGIPTKFSYKKKVKPFQDAEDTTDEADTNEELEGESQHLSKEDITLNQPSDNMHHGAHGMMHKMMDNLEEPPIEGKVNPHHKASFHGHNPISTHGKRKKLSMF